MSRNKITALLAFCILASVVYSQDNPTICVLNFTNEGAEFEKGIVLRRQFESILGEVDPSLQLVEREEVYEILEFIQRENNLLEDIGNRHREVLRSLEIDYVIRGDFQINDLTNEVEFQSECVKLSGENGFLNISFPTLYFSLNEFSNSKIFGLRSKVMLESYKFTDRLGVIPADAFKELQRELDAKEERIQELEEKAVAMTRFRGYAKMNLYGATITNPGDSTQIMKEDSPIISEMKKVFSFDYDKTYNLKHTEEALEACYNVIKIDPDFPFSYYGAAQILRLKGDISYKQFAQKCLDILNYTTIFSDCQEYHEVCLRKIEGILD